MTAALAILGGSTPFTAALIEALRASSARLPACELRLFGTDVAALDRMRRYAQLRLGEAGWVAFASPRLDEVIDGAAVVVQQIRFGGLQGRGHDEDLAARWQLPADETLGPCGLAAALRLAHPLRELAAELGQRCPGAWVLNLSNPLSVTTALMSEACPNSIGLCELPLSTATEICRLLRCSVTDVEWEYAGLNHRGLIWSFRHRGEELLHRLPDLLGPRTVFGITAGEIRRIGAVPLKYLRLTRAGASQERRAPFLVALKEKIAREIDAGEAPPSSLAHRAFDWYPDAVVPALAALFSPTPWRLTANLPEDGIVRELPVELSRAGIRRREVTVPAAVRTWLRPWEDHERAVLEAVHAPSLATVERALELDPIVPPGRARDIAREIWRRHDS